MTPLADSGSKAAEDFKFPTGAYPNQLNSIAIRGSFAYVPSVGASPNGPVRFDVNTHSLRSVIDLYATRTPARPSTCTAPSLRRAIRRSCSSRRPGRWPSRTAPMKAMFSARPAPSPSRSRLIRRQAKSRSRPTRPTQAASSRFRRERNPRGIVLYAGDSRDYVMNYISRDVTVIDIASYPEKAIATLRSTAAPAAGSFEDLIQIGKELYKSSTGNSTFPRQGDSRSPDG